MSCVYTKRDRSHSRVELPQYSAARKEEYVAILVIMKVAIEHQPRSDAGILKRLCIRQIIQHYTHFHLRK